MLSALGRPDDVVETDYRSTIALFTGHRTANTAFVNTLISCTDAVTDVSVSQDNAGYLLIGAVNKPDLIDSPCLFEQATSEPWAVRLLRTDRDQASVFELIGPGTAHPNLVDVTADATGIGIRPAPLLSDPLGRRRGQLRGRRLRPAPLMGRACSPGRGTARPASNR